MYTELNVLNTFHQSRPTTLKFPIYIHKSANNLHVLTPKRKINIQNTPKITQFFENN
jgi:hypothetical protein